MLLTCISLNIRFCVSLPDNYTFQPRSDMLVLTTKKIKVLFTPNPTPDNCFVIINMFRHVMLLSG